MNWFVIKCKIFHQSSWGPYMHGELYPYKTTQCGKCGMIYDEVNESGNSPYELKWYLQGLVITIVVVALLIAVL